MSAIGSAVAPLYVPFEQPVEPWPGYSLFVQQVPIPSEPPPVTAYPPAGPGQGKEPPTEPPPSYPPPGSAGPGQELPPGPPPNVPPPGQGPVVVPGRPPVPTEPPAQPGPVEPPPDDGDGSSSKPWLVAAGVVGAGAAGLAGVVAYRNGARNVRALQATAAAFDSGAMHQGGLQSINDAQLGARFAKGIGTGDYLAVALPGVNRVGGNGRLTSVARGHLDHAELLASSTALRRGTGDAVSVHEPMRRHVISELEGGRSLPSVLDDLDRSAAGAKPAFDNEQLARYWDRTSIVENGPRSGGRHVTSGVDATRPELALGEGRELVETGREARLNQLVAGRDAELGGAGLADGIGTIQGVGVSRLNPEMQRAAIAASGVDQGLVDSVGINAAYSQRWSDRLAAGAAQ